MKPQSKIKFEPTKINIGDKFEKQLQDLVVARLSAIPRNLQMAVGSSQYSIEDLIKSVQENNDIGKQLIIMQVQYLKDLASGEMYKQLDDQQ